MQDPDALSPSDAELLRRSAAGDTAAFERFVTRHEGWLGRFGRAIAGQEADDVVQDAFVDAWRGAATFAGESAKAWLYTIARNAFRRRHRPRAGEPRAYEPVESADELAVRAGWGAGSPEGILEQADSRDLVLRALARLDHDEREAVVLCDLEGRSADEAAAIAGITRAALKSRLHRGRLHLAAVLRGDVYARS